jgi:tRNA threonylcarbamoyladenosine biosynthesis protein TsaE
MPKKVELNTVITNSPHATIKVGEQIAAGLHPGDIIYLCGELGSGKTVFVKGVCRGLGVRDDVTSSSFVIATEYTGNLPISHIDLYRLRRSDIAELPIDEYILVNGVTIIEWADRINDSEKKGIRVNIEIKDKNIREIKIEDFRD